MGLLTGILFLTIGLYLILRYFRARQSCLPIRGQINSYIEETRTDRLGRTTTLFQTVIRLNGTDGLTYIYLHPVSSGKTTKKIGDDIELLADKNDPFKIYPKAPLELLIAFISVFVGAGVIALTYQSQGEFIQGVILLSILFALKIKFKINFKQSTPEVYLEKNAPHSLWES